jgi:COP9 signalosome complex subunit 2
MQGLRTSYEQKNIKTFDEIVANKTNMIANDPFMKDFLDDLRKTILISKIANLVAPYEKVKISYLSKSLRTDPAKIEKYLMELILDGRI